METVRSVSRGLLGFKEPPSLKEERSRGREEERRPLEEEERGKEALQEPVGHRMKRARHSPEVEVEAGHDTSLTSMVATSPGPHLTLTSTSPCPHPAPT